VELTDGHKTIRTMGTKPYDQTVKVLQHLSNVYG